MSKQIKNLSRRTFLKGAAYTSALSIGGISSLAFATSAKPVTDTAQVDMTQIDTDNSVVLFNQSDKTVALDASKPVDLQMVNGWVVVKINKASEQNVLNLETNAIISLSPGQKQTFVVESELAPMLKETSGDYVVITNEFSVLNNMVPISTYDTLVA